MTAVSHHSTVPLSEVVLTMRRDLSLSVREYGGQPLYQIEDEIHSRFFRIELAEYTFLSLLDGRTTFADALGRTASVMKEDALSETEAASFCRWLVENELATTPESKGSARLLEAQQKSLSRNRRSRSNPIFIRVPLLNPDPMLKFATDVAGWLFSWPVFFFWLLVISVGASTVLMHQEDLSSASARIADNGNWMWLVVTTLMLKLLHETAHGIACRRYGGSVREAGVMLLLFVPLPYVDVTSAWRIASRRQRAIVSAAGMAAELFPAALAAIVWSRTDPGLLHQHAFNIMLSASVVTLVFNANPLMRFDGYYILTDCLELPNLASHGQTCLLRYGRRIFFGLNDAAPEWPEGRTKTIVLYGILAFLWRIVICIGMVVAADALYFGAGILIAAVALVLWVIKPLAGLLRFAVQGSDTEQPQRLRFFGVTGGMLAGAMLVWAFVPWSARIQAPAVVDYEQLVDVRAGVSGFVDQVFVDCGDVVDEGQILFVLRNAELEQRRVELVTEIEQSRHKSRRYFGAEEVAAWQVESSNEASLATQLNELDRQREQLILKAPVSGVVLDASPQTLRNTYANSGARVLTIGATDSKQIIALIAPGDAELFSAHVDEPVDVHLWGTGVASIRGILQPPAPRATTEILHPAFSASAGGPIAVHQVPVMSASGPEHAVQFLEPQLRITVRVETAALQQQRAGRSGIVSFRKSRGSIGAVLTGKVSSWWRDRQRSLQRSWAY